MKSLRKFSLRQFRIVGFEDTPSAITTPVAGYALGRISVEEPHLRREKPIGDAPG
ncbi:hypothetical protein [Bradyrhizobium viridifuturi]|uniref:hypothetical protein n=1 Tax=Bradyrhizobium viridifuturi TaxID=1654716 RepID=UPI001AEBDC35|nr:hypothetical protein [Bradyrhizobium viridifuturi]